MATLAANYDVQLARLQQKYRLMNDENLLKQRYGIGNTSSSTTSSPSSTNATNSASSLDAMKDAKTLAEMKLGNELTLMEKSHGYRSSEAAQQQGFRQANATQDSDIRMREAGQQHGFNLESKQRDYQYTSDLSRQNHGYNLENKAADYKYADALGKSQYGYQLGLQQDNNAARLRMQDDAQEHDKRMFNARDEADSRRISTAYDRARSAFRGRY